MTAPRLKQVALIVAGQSPASEDVTDLDGGLPFMQGNAEFGTVHPSPIYQCEAPPKQAQRGDVLISVRAPVGAINVADQNYGIGRGLAAVRPLAIDTGYLKWLLSHSVEELRSIATGSTFEAVSASDLGAIRILQTGRVDQRAISDFLDRETAQIDAMIEAQRQLVARLEERRGAILEATLDEIWTAPHRRLQWLYRVSDECNQPDLQVLSVYRDYGVILKSSRDDNFNRTPENLERYLVVRPHDLVVNRMKAWQGSLGVSRHEGIVSGDYEVVRPASPDLLPDFAHFMLRSPRLIGEYRARSTGIRPAQWRLYWEAMGKIEVPVPPLEIQQHQLDQVRASMSRMDTMIAAATESIALMQERRSALISAAVTGRIDPATGQEHPVTQEAS